MTSLEDAIDILDPAKTELVPDDTPAYNATVLYLESQRGRGGANDEKIHLGHRGVMNLVPYQLDPALQALLGLKRIPAYSQTMQPHSKRCASSGWNG